MKFYRTICTGPEFLELGEKQRKGLAIIYSAARGKTNSEYVVEWAELKPDKIVTIFD